MPVAPLEPARPAFAADGTPYSEIYGDLYHSAAGGLEQARRVFLAGNRLPERWMGRERFVILETGFGLGLNFLATWHAWRADPGRCGRLHYLAAEKHPFARDDLATLHERLPELTEAAARLRDAWPLLVPGYHRLHLDAGRVVLTLMFGAIADTLPKLRARADALYLDGFAPAKNPDMWSPQVFRSLAHVCAPGATLATWSVAGSVRDGLAAAGFATEKQPGFGPKREMLAGHYAPAQRAAGSSPAPRSRVLVLGAGIAGSAVAERLGARGWEVEVIDRRPAPAGGPLDPIAGVFKPMFSRDDNIASRLSRAGCLAALRHWQALAAAGLPLKWAPCGVLQVARNARQEQDFADILAAHRYPADYAAPLSAADAALLAGRQVAGGGMLVRAGGWINPISLCASNLLRHGAVRVHWGREAAAVRRNDGAWRVMDRDGSVIAEAPLLVLANAHEANALPQAAALPFRKVRGQASFLPAEALGPLSLVVCREGCVTPAAQGVGSVGATFDSDDDPEPRLESHASNLERLERLLPGASAGLDPARLDGRVGFRTATPDRLPLAGAL
ncbi:MAG TPA: bifunctional tRNA (5-methylaminomethyl-2-thiouridine)(34)-methyltransferase MnmD/FAD-dependent 5-carboxymethylaminomethyl-2-thiouridine(34) oxidoreductase MnmC, partial [Burkholderiales bacterium]|nr:bifunctional tRNA (5-methylaminomethyl-2-thiouridine)(34)-methyltransferase MnmD/FAD-dependent 5-carboxymethylaminomethyl-2-thiouridine(34) oxidoreductase MnmC [Burkholderiales bacterium]